MLHQGQRVYPDDRGVLVMPRCSYGKDIDGIWHIRGPRGNMGVLDPKDDKWSVIEHADGSITVSPSLDCDEWHGYLERGIFRDI